MWIEIRLALADPSRDVCNATVFIPCTYTKQYIRLGIFISFPHSALLCSPQLSCPDIHFSHSIPSTSTVLLAAARADLLRSSTRRWRYGAPVLQVTVVIFK
jgi:hypothetical protein